jgi:beta-N-acetylhexosaminidase
VLAVNAGNDMLISSDFKTQYDAVLAAVSDGTISEDRLYDAALRVVTAKLKSGIIK